MKKTLLVLAAVMFMWVCKEFSTWSGALDFLNSLPPETAATAKIVTFQPAMGAGQGYGVVYQKESSR